MKLAPLGDKVVLKQLEAEETTKSGLILTSSSQEKPQEAIVVAVGPGGLVGDVNVEMVLKRRRPRYFPQIRCYSGSNLKGKNI